VRRHGLQLQDKKIRVYCKLSDRNIREALKYAFEQWAKQVRAPHHRVSQLASCCPWTIRATAPWNEMVPTDEFTNITVLTVASLHEEYFIWL
jgi:hypothetical protein